MAGRRTAAHTVLLLSILLVGFWQRSWSAPGDSPPGDERAVALTALQKLNGVIGEWRGTAQPQRGSSRGAWSQTSQFVWDFTSPLPAIRYIVKDGKLTKEGRITWNAAASRYELKLQPAEGAEQLYSGDWTENRLVLETAADDKGVRSRVSVTPLNEKRVLVLHETSLAGGQSFRRVAEVGYTREGTRLALSGSSGPECIVTGGAGTMAVSHQGQTYYVCCTGCKQAFDEDPKGIIAAYQARLKALLDGVKKDQ